MRIEPGNLDHLSNDSLVRSLDGELTSLEVKTVEGHLEGCALCRRRQAELQEVSVGLSRFVHAETPLASTDERIQLLARLEAARGDKPVPLSRTLGRFGWALAAAASLALGLAYVPFSRTNATVNPAEQTRVPRVGSPFEVEGETFFYLPYSNPDLPASSHVVQMKVPLSSLADAGVLVAPIEARMATPDRAVLADVLLGLDGQPVGVHVLSSD